MNQDDTAISGGLEWTVRRYGRSVGMPAACRATIRPKITQFCLARRAVRAKFQGGAGSGEFHMGNVGSSACEVDRVAKNFLPTIFVFVALACWPTSANSCDSPISQADMNICSSNADQKSDKQLNDLYRKIVGLLSDDHSALDLFNSAQRAWTDFRDSECKFVASGYEGGSIQGMVRSKCLRTLNDLRAEGFRRFIECEDGGNNCYAEFVPPT